MASGVMDPAEMSMHCGDAAKAGTLWTETGIEEDKQVPQILLLLPLALVGFMPTVQKMVHKLQADVTRFVRLPNAAVTTRKYSMLLDSCTVT